MNVLVIDSDRVSRRLAALLLGRLDAPAAALADTVADALAALPAGPCRLALLAADRAPQELPALRGAVGAQARIVAMLARDTAEMRRACLDAGADEVIVKPLTMAALASVLARAVSAEDDFNGAAWSGLRELFGAAGVDKLRATLVDDLPVQQGRLADAIRDEDLSALKRLAHTMHGVSLQLGATALAGQWALAEQAAAAGEGDAALRLGASLMARHAALVERLRGEWVS